MIPGLGLGISVLKPPILVSYPKIENMVTENYMYVSNYNYFGFSINEWGYAVSFDYSTSTMHLFTITDYTASSLTWIGSYDFSAWIPAYTILGSFLCFSVWRIYYCGGGTIYQDNDLNGEVVYSIANPASSIFVNVNGTVAYTISGYTTLKKYTFGTAYRIDTITEVASITLSDVTNLIHQYGGVSGIFVSDDGLRLYVGDSQNRKVHQFIMSTAFDISTLSYYSALPYIGLYVHGIFLNPTETKLFTIDGSSYVTGYKY